jgi:hypothetical protein
MLRKNKKEASLVMRFTRFGRMVVISAQGVKSSFTEVWIHSRLATINTWLLLRIISSQLRNEDNGTSMN